METRPPVPTPPIDSPAGEAIHLASPPLVGWVVVHNTLILMLLLFPFSYRVLPSVGQWLRPGTEWLVTHLGQAVWGPGFWGAVVSDSPGLYLLGALAVLAGALAAWPLARWVRRRGLWPAWQFGVHTAAAYYVALQLLIYGLDKVFKHQFYLPEPNTLFTPLGQLTPDLLYWSTMGISRPYTVFAGIIEVLPALLLLHRRTRGLGALGAVAVLANVVALNFSYDISVKFYALLLLAVAGVAATPAVRAVWAVFGRGAAPAPVWRPQLGTRRAALSYAVAKSLVISLMLFEALFIYFQTGNFNDDAAPRPAHHGAFAVDVFVYKGDTIPLTVSDNIRPRRIFFHRQGYFVVQHANESLHSHPFSPEPAGIRLLGADSRTAYLETDYNPDSTRLLLRGNWHNLPVQMHCRRLPLDSLPLLRPHFHWTVRP